MKNQISGYVAIALLLTSCSQNIDTRNKIEVSGSAEAEATPDIIYVGISLKEFFRDNKNKATIEELEIQLQKAAMKAGVAKNNFTINNVSSHNYEYERRKNSAFLARKQYRLKVTHLNKFNQIIGSIDPRSIEYTTIEGYDYSNIEAIKRDLKIEALKAAKDKASYLAAAVGDKVGDALEINEINNGTFPSRMNQMDDANGAVDMAVEQSSAMPEINFKNIKLNYQIHAVFELID